MKKNEPGPSYLIENGGFDIHAYKRLKRRSLNKKYVFRAMPTQEVNFKIMMMQRLFNINGCFTDEKIK